MNFYFILFIYLFIYLFFKEAKETGQLNAMPDCGLDPRLEGKCYKRRYFGSTDKSEFKQ